MSPEFALAALLGAPLLQALLVLALSRPPGLRDLVHVLGSGAVAVLAGYLVHAVSQGASPRIVLANPLPNVELAFAAEPLGTLAAAVVGGVGFLHAIHTSGMVRAIDQKAPARLMAFSALTTAAAMAVMFSANLFSFFVAYQALALAAFPLVAHVGDDEARTSARLFLAMLLGASIALLLPAMIWTYTLSGTLEFQVGGVLAGRIDLLSANALLVLFVLGIAAAAAPPMHRWLTMSFTAPYPALVKVQALAVLPAGGVGLLKVFAYVFGPALISEETGRQILAAQILLGLCGVIMCAAAVIALSKTDIRERLAYSLWAQALAAIIGGLLAAPAGLFAAALQIVATSCAATTLLMAVGTTAAVTGRNNVADYPGLGRVMPWTFAGFAIACASIIGMPPFSGAWSKLWLITASASTGVIWAAGLVGVAAVLTFAHLGPLAANAFAGRAPTDAFKRPDGASILLVAPVILGAAATLGLLVLADPLASFLSPVWTPR
jgi:multicomponent Na+:H+ antiporter subunit D